MLNWFLLGVIGWALLMVYRRLVDGPPNYPWKTYIPGFVFAVVLGPIAFGILIYMAITDYQIYLSKKKK